MANNSVEHAVDSLLTVQQVAKMLNVHPNSIRQWSNAGELTYYRLGRRGDRRFRLADVEAFLAARRSHG